MCKTSKTTQSTQIPQWATDASQFVVSQGKDLAQKPFEAYTEPRVADFSGDQENAFAQLRNLIASAPQVGQQALSGITQASTAPASTVSTERVVDEGGRLGAISDYMSPYVDATLTPVFRQIQEAADKARNAQGARATSAGAFGDARHGIVEAALNRDTTQAMTDATGKAYADAFNQAMGQRGADLGRFMTADQSTANLNETALQRLMSGSMNLENVASADQNRGLQAIQALLASGGTQQGLEQLGLDKNYEEFLRKYGNDFNVLAALSGAMKGLPMDSKTISTQPDNSGLGALGSLAGSAISAPAGSAAATFLATL